jgi:hypothetical protein
MFNRLFDFNIKTPQTPAEVTKTITLISTSMSDISSLQQKAAALGRTLDCWSNVYVVGLVAALIAGAVTLAASYRIISNNRKLAVVNADIGRAKDALVAESNERTARLEREVAEAKTKQAQAERSLLELRHAVAPRIIDQGTNVQSALRPFAGTNAIIEFISDREAKETAEQISLLINIAGWISSFRRPTDNEAMFRDGINIDPGFSLSDQHVRAAAETLVKQLIDKSRVAADVAPCVNPELIPENTLLIRVGKRPEKYFSDKFGEENQ